MVDTIHLLLWFLTTHDHTIIRKCYCYCFLQIWRGLWYCMWMCDKAAIQSELAVRLSQMTHLFADDPNEGLRFQAAFYSAMRR
jgi:Nucleolar protein,Nop52